MSASAEHVVDCATKYLQNNSGKFDKVEGSSDWFLFQVGSVAAQLLEGSPRDDGAYDLTKFKSKFGVHVELAPFVGSDKVLKQLVVLANLHLSAIANDRPKDYEQYSELFLPDVLKVVYNLTE